MRRIAPSVDQGMPKLIGMVLVMMALSLVWTAVARAQSAEDQYKERTPPSDPIAEGTCVHIESADDAVNDGDLLTVKGDFSVASGASLVLQDEDGTQGTVIEGENAKISGDPLQVSVTGDPINVSGGDGTVHADACPEVVSTTGVSAEESPSGVAGAVMGLLPDTGGLLPVSVLGGLAVIGVGVAILWHRPRQ